MRMCSFPGCQRLGGHGATVPHAMWDAARVAWVPLTEQRTRAQILAESRDRMRREKAERIADAELRAFNDRHGFTVRTVVNGDGHMRMIREMLTAAALAALTEKEAAR